MRILYDDEAIYVGVTLFDTNPTLIMTTDSRRDPSLGDMDSFQMIFDTFHDKQNGFVFGTNAAGVQYDAQVRFQGNQQASWDGSWDVSTELTETAWTAEFRIPLRTLRYGPAPQTWGVNFFRNIQRTRERAYWAPIERVFNLGRLSSAGDLRGLQLETPRNFKLLPYTVGSADRDFAPRRHHRIRGRHRVGREVRRHAQPEPGRDAQHRLRAGGGGHPADQPDALQPALPGEAAVLPGELRAVHHRQGHTSWICSSAGGSGSTRTAGWCRSAAAGG